MTSTPDYDARRSALKPWRAWYSLTRWKRRRREQLDREPLCQRCKAKGIIEPATVAHHIDQHQGDADLFWHGELRSSCKPCHDIIEQAIEARGFEVGCDTNGRPIAADHPWNRNMAMKPTTYNGLWAQDAARKILHNFTNTASIETSDYQLCSFIFTAAKLVIDDINFAKQIEAQMENPREADAILMADRTMAQRFAASSRPGGSNLCRVAFEHRR